MALGSAVRRLFGPHEYLVAALYRAVFLDIEDYAELIRRWVPEARTILEVGCGEGAVTERLASLYPEARVTAIDITPSVGRLYRGRREGVDFRQTTIQAVAAEQPQAFDFIVLSDVLHHVPDGLRAGILEAIGDALAPGGAFLFKDWERRATPIHWLCYASDRWLTGDRIRYLREDEAHRLVTSALPGGRIAETARIRPWDSNFAMLVTA
jgi:2-polyprenyl-6-hydroxyphenyl methylase/3-demethylubiquinone-9 3-methyltransferase